MLSPEKIEELNQALSDESPRTIIKEALALIPDIALSFSGAEDVVLVDMASKLQPELNVFTLDTGRLPPETYQFLDNVRSHYGIDLQLLNPDPAALEDLVRRKGLFSFYQDGHEECCGIRKIEPLRRKLRTVRGWITGQRRDQSPTRARVEVFEIDATFSRPGQTLVKVNPLANWTLKQVWDYIQMFEVPYNSLHDRGFVSIGCEPCTRAIRPGQHEREGRWWWEEATLKECGLHRGNLGKAD